ncbi:ABC transporter [Thioflexithrix psekupsensis]|uniref:ABC transporter n=2 Tax=Thioflexithrix psekupsensis TaxID=1570016 RepID=A0A251X6Y5_9GAMM|nr:ABC transporter [Thioflexithrix psekupsensis]
MTTIPVSDSDNADPLLACLVALSHWYQRPQSAAALLAGLPLSQPHLTPELFIRAAERLQLKVRIVRRSLSQLRNWQLPAVLLLADDQACVLLKHKDSKTLSLLLPNTELTPHECPRADIESDYTGYALLIQADYNFDQRVPTENRRHWFWQSIRSAWGLYAEVILASFLINLFALAMPLFIMNVYDRVVPNQAIETLWVLASGLGIVLLFEFIIRLLRSYFIDLAGKRIDLLLSSRLFEQIINTPRAKQPQSVGAMANQLHEFESLREFLTSATLTTLIDLPFALLFIFIIRLIHPQLAQVPLLAIPLILLIGVLVQIPLRRAVYAQFRAGTQKQALLVEALAGLETLKLQQAEGTWQKRWEMLLETTSQYSLTVRFLSNMTLHVALFIQQLATVFIIIIGVYLIVANELTVGALIATTLLTGRALVPLTQIASLLTRYHQSRSAYQLIAQFMQHSQERGNNTFLHQNILQGNIDCQHLDFRYPHQDYLVLNDLSLHIKAGEKVGILGRSGCGKSTLAKLLLKLYSPDRGQILFDGIHAAQIDPAHLRQYIAYMPQEGQLFYGSIRDNITLANPRISETQMKQAAELAGVTEFVNSHPQGFDGLLGERGEGLSGGQRQAILLARALIWQPPIVLLDEPTAAMDNGTEERLKQRLHEFLKSRTLILMTHRPSLLSLVDYLIVLDAGRVVASGPKNQVIEALANGQVKTVQNG